MRSAIYVDRFARLESLNDGEGGDFPVQHLPGIGVWILVFDWLAYLDIMYSTRGFIECVPGRDWLITLPELGE